jgi:hypothetical protein
MAVIVHVVLRGLTPQQYDQVRERVGWLDAPPVGGLAHLSWWEDEDNHNTDAWESDADFLSFAENRLGPVLAELGIDIQPEVSFQPAYEVFAPERVVDVMPSEPSDPLPVGLLVTGVDSSSGEPALFRVDVATGAESAVSVGGSFSAPVGITVEADGSILVADADAFGGSGGVIRVDPASGPARALGMATRIPEHIEGPTVGTGTTAQRLREDLLVVNMIIIGLIGVVIDRLLLQLTKIPSVRWGYER